MLFMTQDARPVLHCGICNSPILQPEAAVISYPFGIKSGHLHRVSLSHQGECHRKAEEFLENDQGKAMSMSFSEYAGKYFRPPAKTDY